METRNHLLELRLPETKERCDGKVKEKLMEKAIRDAQKIGITKAARKHGITYHKLWRQTKIKGVEIPKHIHYGKGVQVEELAVLQVLFPGYPFSPVELAEICGVSSERIRQLIESALKKTRSALWEKGIKGDDY